jgi:murein DD-endopeptidase MepM/ murein hydrolase activator NlpD
MVFCPASTPAARTADVPSNQSDLEKQIAAQENQLKQISTQIAESNKKIKSVKQREEKVIRDISTLSSKMAEAEQRLNVTVLKRNQIQNKLADTKAKILDTEKKIESAKQMLSARIVAAYKYGGVAEFSLFMSARGAQDAISTSYMLARIADQDKALISNLSEQKETLDKARAELERQKAELDSRNKELEKQKTTIQQTSQERNKLLQQVRKDKALFLAEQDELLKASKELKGKVTDLLSAKKRMQQAGNKASTPIYFKGGKLAWPLKGKITSPYGTRVHPVFKTKATHTGLDIDGNRGDPVRAASDGEVLYTGWLRGYGQVVILDHGGDLTTVYAHLSGIDTSENAKVKTGDKIGRVGSTGVATGNHLHFEVRINGNTTDPMKYLN